MLVRLVVGCRDARVSYASSECLCDVDVVCAKCLYMDVKLKGLFSSNMDRALLKLLMNFRKLLVSSRLTVGLRV